MSEDRDMLPFVPIRLDALCPKCASPVEVRHWESRYYTKCTGHGCFYGFDSDEKGKPTLPCPACGKGHLKTTSKGRVCSDCGKWQVSGTEDAKTVPGADTQGPIGACPKCHKGQLAVRKGQYGTFVSCSERCGLTYGSNDLGVPEGGQCKHCKGPVKKTQSGSRICAVCEKWQDEKAGSLSSAGSEDRPPKPKDAKCPVCHKQMKTIWTKRKKWAYLCEDCTKWYDT